MRVNPCFWVGALTVLFVARSGSAKEIALPAVLIEGMGIELIASEPDLVTPVGCVIDDAGGLLVIESHTHFAPDDYDGPGQDRIYRFDDSDGDGTLDRQRLFFEGGTATMGLANVGDGWIAVARRSELVKIRDSDGDGIAEQTQTLLSLRTKANYPHNGLGGITLGPDGWLYVGQGENLGEAYELVGSDHTIQRGGGEGGNVFRIRPDGTRLERFATGFWNPFGLHFDAADRLWAVGNDPDAMPPCRLLHVVHGGDYGFQFMFGRSGTHPLQSWDGDLPGTLPMAAGTGEAPCAVVQFGNALWVTSWGSNRIERYRLTHDGASVKGTMEVVVQGGPSFRPVGMAVGSDGSIYLTDWVDRSYPVHGKGRLWRLSITDPPAQTATPFAVRSALEQFAWHLSDDANLSVEKRIVALADDDPFVRQSAVTGLINTGQLENIKREAAKSPHQRVGLLSAWRWRELCEADALSAQQRSDWLAWGIGDSSPEVAVAAVRWAAERDCVEQLPAIKARLSEPQVSPQLFATGVAAIAYLDSGSASSGTRDPAREEWLLRFASDREQSAGMRALAISMIPAETESPTVDQLGEWASEVQGRRLGGEIVRLLVERASPEAIELVAQLAADKTLPDEVRADAIAGLARNAGLYSRVLNLSARPGEPELIRREAQRVLRRVRTQGATRYPSPDDVEAWASLTAEGGDPQAGRRVFFRTTCANCHAHSGRGSRVGPDLTNLSGHMNRARLVESILLPSREVGPLFVTWKVLTVDGKVLTGMRLDRDGEDGSLRFLGAEGDQFEVPLDDIDTVSPVAASIMPAGLGQTMSVEEFRDLIAFLENPSW